MFIFILIFLGYLFPMFSRLSFTVCIFVFLLMFPFLQVICFPLSVYSVYCLLILFSLVSFLLSLFALLFLFLLPLALCPSPVSLPFASCFFLFLLPFLTLSFSFSFCFSSLSFSPHEVEEDTRAASFWPLFPLSHSKKGYQDLK